MANLVSCRKVILATLIASFLLVTLKPIEANAGICRFSFVSKAKLPDKVESTRSNIFGKSWKSTVANSVVWLAGVQLAKYMLLPEGSREYFTEALLVTVPLDVGLTIVSHYLSLANIGWLNKLQEGKLFGPKHEFWSRVGFNTAFSTGGILASWKIAGLFGIDIPINSETALAAFTLSAVVYTSMQVIKPKLFKNLPRLSTKYSEHKLRQILKDRLEPLKRQILVKQNFYPEDPALARDIFLKSLDIIVSQQNWPAKARKLINNKILDKSDKISLEKLLVDYKNAETEEEALDWKYQIMKRLVKLKHRYPLEIEKDLFRLTSLNSEQSFALVERVIKNRRDDTIGIVSASLIDQGLWVGVAGGVLLYSTTHWAIHDELPEIIRQLGE